MDTNTSKYKLLELIALSGESSTDICPYLGISKNYQRNLIADLKRKGLIRTHNKDRLKGYRLTAKSKKFLLEMNPERFSFFLTGNAETHHPRSELTRRLRLQQASRTYALLLQAGVRIFRDEKPCLFGAESDGIREIICPVFYHSRELKELGTETVKIDNSRLMGILLGHNGIYPVYYTGGSLIKWEYRTEIRVKALLRHHITQGVLSAEMLCPGYPLDAPIRAMFIGSDMGAALQLMTSTGGYRKSYFHLDGSFEYFHFIPDTPAGVTLLKVLCSPKLCDALGKLLLSDLDEPDPNLGIEHDALSDGMPVLLAFDFEMLRITRFHTALCLHNLEGNLVCFDFQKDVLEQYFGDTVTITTIDLVKFERRFFPWTEKN